MTQIKTSELCGAALDWAVAKCEGRTWIHAENFLSYYEDEDQMHYSTDWAQGGPIIERERVELVFNGKSWDALQEGQHIPHEGKTPLIAAMRCYVASKLGDTIEVPEALK